jgi:hypothetical protein
MTNYWFVTHDIPSYRQEPDKIGRGIKGARRDKVFRGIKDEDRIIYYVKNKVVAGVFRVISDMYLSPKSLWDGKPNTHYVYDIEPIYASSIERPIRIDPEDYKLQHKQRTVIKLSPDQYKNIALDILGMDEPRSEAGVISLFCKVHRELGFPFIKVLRDRFPDCIAVNNRGKEIRIEFEEPSSKFDHDPKGCDLIVCWKDDLGKLALVDVLELREFIYGH